MAAMHYGETGKLALVLAGGGLTGAVYEIGALRAIDDLMLDRTVNDFDIYVGTSAGAIVASFLANGVSADEMYQVIEGTHPAIPPIARQHIFNFNQEELLQRLLGLPGHAAAAWRDYVRHLRRKTPMDFLWSLTSNLLPSALYDGMALERYMRESLHTLAYSNDFTRLGRDLFIVATSLDTGERTVFSTTVNSHVPVSLAVAASTALPMIYKPVRIENREYIDGGMRGTASLDLAIENGATLVVCVNPLVPFTNAGHNGNGRAEGDYLSASGVSAIATQVSRIVMHSGLRYQIKQLRRQHPGVDIILIEPHADDAQMFHGNIMNYSTRQDVARHGFESVTLDLAEDYYAYKEILACHGVPISRRLVVEELAEIRESGYDPHVIQRVLGARRPNCSGARRDTPLCQLSRALAALELQIETRASQVGT